MRKTLMTNAFILCLVVVLKFQPSIGNVNVDETGHSLSNLEQELEGNVPDHYPVDAIKRAMMRQHALRLKRGGFNSGFAHALRVRRGGIGQRSSWGHALRVRSSNMLNRGHALRIKRKPGANDYRAFALRVRKNGGDELTAAINAALAGQDLSDEAMEPGIADLEQEYLDHLMEKKSDSEIDEDVAQYRDKKSPMRYQPAQEGVDLLKEYYGNRFLNSWPMPARRLRSASFAHVLRV